jgi:Lrp/AsnC family transcriptional regulator for asnA, asnC and gidA
MEYMSSTSTADRILDALEADAQASYAEIADRADVSKPTVRKYIDQLEEDGVIVGYSAEIDPKKLSGRTIALVGIEAESDRYVEATRGLKSVDAVERLYTSSGDHMFMAEVRAADGEELGDVIGDQLLDIDGVEAAHPSVLQERIK